MVESVEEVEKGPDEAAIGIGSGLEAIVGRFHRVSALYEVRTSPHTVFLSLLEYVSLVSLFGRRCRIVFSSSQIST